MRLSCWMAVIVCFFPVLAWAETPCCPEGKPLPTLLAPPIALFNHPTQPAPCEAKPLTFAPLRLFEIFHATPKVKEAPPAPPIRLFTLVPPSVHCLPQQPPCVQTFRIEHQGPKQTCAAPAPPITVFRAVACPPKGLPPLQAPPITVVTQHPPEVPVCVK